MPAANTNTVTTDIGCERTIRDRITDAVRHATHLSHEARLVTSMARDAGEEGVHAAKRIVRRVRSGIEALEDRKDDAAHYVRQRPFKAVSMATGAGLMVGLLVGWIVGRFGGPER